MNDRMRSVQHSAPLPAQYCRNKKAARKVERYFS